MRCVFLLLLVASLSTLADATGARKSQTKLNSYHDTTGATIRGEEATEGQGNLRKTDESLADGYASTATAATATVLRVLGATEHWTQLLVVGLLVLFSAAGMGLVAFTFILGEGKITHGNAQGLVEWAGSPVNRAVDIPADDGFLSHALLVRAPGGSAYIISGEISPHPQEEAVTVTNAGTNKLEANAFISETGFDTPAIHLETPDGITVATLDTAAAIYPENAMPPPSSNRFVLVKNANDKLFARVDAEFGASQAKCIVQRLSETGQPLGLLISLHYDEKEELVHIVGAAGDIVGQPQLERLPDGSQRRLLAVRQGADLALVLCAALAFRKLS